MLDEKYMQLGFSVSMETFNTFEPEMVEPLNNESLVIPKERLLVLHDNHGNLTVPADIQFIGTLRPPT